MRPVPLSAIQRPLIFFSVGFAMCVAAVVTAIVADRRGIPGLQTAAYVLMGAGLVVGVGSTIAGLIILLTKSFGGRR